MYYDKGRHIEQQQDTYNFVVLTAEQLLHDSDAVDHSDGFEMIRPTTRTPVIRTISINFWMSQLRMVPDHPFLGIPSSDAVSSKSFQVAMFFYNSFVFFRDSSCNSQLLLYKRYFSNTIIQIC